MVEADTSSGEGMDDWLTPAGRDQEGDQFDSVVLELRKRARIDRTSTLAAAGVALTVREELEDTVSVERLAGEGEPDVLVDESIGVVVVEDEGPDDANLIFEVIDDEELAEMESVDEESDDPDEIELSIENTAGLDHLVVYANERVDATEETWERLQSEYTAATLGLAAISFVGGPTGSAF